MREPRNPFRLRSSESIESHSTFLRLFSPGVLGLLQKDGSWNRVQIFRSAPGGGKTSLLRLFTPDSLLTLHDFRAIEEYKDLYNELKALEVISEQGPQVLGILLSCAKNYDELDDLEFDAVHRRRLFYSLLNSRIILAALRSALILRKLNYPNDLARLRILRPSSAHIPSTIPVPCSGLDLHNWASSLEKQVCNAIDSFGSPQVSPLIGQDTLDSLILLQPGFVQLDDAPVAQQTLLMLDDIHKLTSVQRRNLLSGLFDLRLPMGVWIAERLEAMGSEELLAPGAAGREYDEVKLEDYWRREGRPRQFERTLADIAERRARLNPEVEIGSYEGCLQSSLDGSEWEDGFSQALQAVSERIRKRVGATRTYENWVAQVESATGTPRERAIKWRVLEIKIERESRKAQRKLLDLPLPEEGLEEQELSTLKETAELFLASEFEFPYYFGFPRLAKLASSNIEQFLMMAGDLFEEVISAQLLKQPATLPPTRQEDMLEQAAKRRWVEIPNSVPNGRDVMHLLEAICGLCCWETGKPNAPYAPGVTGVAISMTDRAKLTDPSVRGGRQQFARLANALCSCISKNLLEASLDRKQGSRGGEPWMIVYLNRLLCACFGLPLQYGGWRPVKLDELCRYLDQPFSPPRRKGGSK